MEDALIIGALVLVLLVTAAALACRVLRRGRRGPAVGPPPFEVRELADGRWAVAAREGPVLFVGSRRECEDWLDARENGPP